MKRAANIINYILKPLGVKIVNRKKCNFDMKSALRRIVNDHNFAIDNVIDIGGSNGRWSLGAMKIFPSASFLAIEPLYERSDALQSIAQRYRNFSFELCAAGESNNEKVILNVADNLDGSTIDGFGGEQRQVPTKTIDAIVQERKLTGPFLIKLDTHGYEIPIFKGAEQTLNRTSVIIVEAYNFKITNSALRFHQLCYFLEDSNFRCFDIADLMLREHDNSLWQMDLFFCKSNEPIFTYPNFK